jgi:cytochrome bd-type quinol oxidase subunit 2
MDNDYYILFIYGIPIIIIIIGIIIILIIHQSKRNNKYANIMSISIIIIGLLGYSAIIIPEIINSLILHSNCCCEYTLCNMKINDLTPLYDLLFYGAIIDIPIIALGFIFIYFIELPIMIIYYNIIKK